MPTPVPTFDVWEVFEQRFGNKDKDFKRTYKRIFRCDTNDQRIGSKSVRDAVLLFAGQDINSGYRTGDPLVDWWAEEDTGCSLQLVEAQPSSDRLDGCGWEVTFTYQPATTTQDANPLDAPPRIDYGFAQFEVPCILDKDGNPVRNSAGEFFDPPLRKDDSRTILKITVNVKTYDPTWIEQYRDSVNSVLWLNRQPRTCKLGSMTATEAESPLVPGDHKYFIVNMEVHHNRDTWDKVVVDQGFTQVIGGLRSIIYARYGQPPSTPRLLDGTGKALPTAGTPVLGSFRVYKEIDFAMFGFGAPA